MFKDVPAPRRKLAGASALVALAALFAAQARAAIVEVAVSGIKEARGHIRVGLCTKQTFLKHDCPYEGAAPAEVGSTVVKIADVPPGEYAVQAFHDDTDQGVVHQNFLGIPREAVGFSNDPPIGLHGPSFRDAAFSVEHGVARISLTLRHILHSH
ncbi:MAG: DUF2141 domain-containing protein [Caulobacteraceae bacterium]